MFSSGMRQSADIFIYVDLQKAIDAGYKFELSANGVVLTAGNEKGFLPTEFFQRVEQRVSATNRVLLPGWEDNLSRDGEALNSTIPPPHLTNTGNN
jgi:2'-phosphotransferase